MTLRTADAARLVATCSLAALWCGPAAADSACLPTDPAEHATLRWNDCTADERLSVALGVLLHERFHERYAPITLDSALLMHGFDRAMREEGLPIDPNEARELLARVRPPADPGERYAWRLHRLLDCRESEERVIVRRLEGGDERAASVGADEPGAGLCLEAASADEGRERRFEADEQVTVRYRRDVIGKHEFRTLTRAVTAEPLDEDDESTAFTVGETIEGWQTALQRMVPMVDYEIVIPPSQGYGQRGVTDRVEPGEYLRFVMRLECDGLPPSEHPDCAATSP